MSEKNTDTGVGGAREAIGWTANNERSDALKRAQKNGGIDPLTKKPVPSQAHFEKVARDSFVKHGDG